MVIMACETHASSNRRMNIFSREFRLVMAIKTQIGNSSLKEFLILGLMREVTRQTHAVLDRRMSNLALEFFLVVTRKT